MKTRELSGLTTTAAGVVPSTPWLLSAKPADQNGRPLAGLYAIVIAWVTPLRSTRPVITSLDPSGLTVMPRSVVLLVLVFGRLVWGCVQSNAPVSGSRAWVTNASPKTGPVGPPTNTEDPSGLTASMPAVRDGNLAHRRAPVAASSPSTTPPPVVPGNCPATYTMDPSGLTATARARAFASKGWCGLM